MMAVVDSVAVGNYSNFAVTFGGIEPQPGDTVRLFHAVTFDVNVAGLAKLEVLASGGITIATVREINCLIEIKQTLGAGGGITATGATSKLVTDSDIFVTDARFVTNNAFTHRIECRDLFAAGVSTSTQFPGFSLTCREIHISGGTLVSFPAQAGAGPATIVAQKISGEGGSVCSYLSSGIATVTADEIIGNTSGAVWDPLITIGSLASLLSRVRAKTYNTGPRGQWPVQGPCYLTDDLSNVVRLAINPDGPYKNLGDPETLGDQPAESDVRDQVVYGFGNLEGTLKVPTASQTAKDVPVDDTFGEAVLTQQDVQDAVGLTEPNLGAKLDAIPTPISFGRTTQILLSDKGNRQIIWPEPNKTITGTIQWSGQAAKPIEGDITFRETVGDVHFYDWEYDEADRPETVGWGIVLLQDDEFVDEPLVVTFVELDQAVNVVPAFGRVPQRGDKTNLKVFYGETIQQSLFVFNEDGSPKDMSGRVLRLVFERKNGSKIDVDVIEGNDLTITDNEIRFSYTTQITTLLGTREWSLREPSNGDIVHLYGTLQVSPAARKDS
jgi:hypothetical protein